MNDPIANILTATRLATGTDPRPVDRHELAQARRVAAILLREQRGMSQPEICRALGIGRVTVADTLKRGQRPASVAEAVERARKLLQGVHK